MNKVELGKSYLACADRRDKWTIPFLISALHEKKRCDFIMFRMTNHDDPEAMKRATDNCKLADDAVERCIDNLVDEQFDKRRLEAEFKAACALQLSEYEVLADKWFEHVAALQALARKLKVRPSPEFDDAIAFIKAHGKDVCFREDNKNVA